MLRCFSPVDGSLYAERAVHTLSAAQDSVRRARAAQKEWARVPLGDRIEVVLAGVARLGDENDEVVPELAWQMGRPVRHGGEFGGVRERAEYMAEIADEALAPIEIESGPANRRFIRRKPHGVVFVIAPWNYPYLTAINALAPALVAGNAVVLKMATQTLLAGERLTRAFCKAGIPEDLFQNLFLDHDTTGELVRAGSFDFINFTGSVAGGRKIETAAAGTFVGLGLELGGKDPGYVMQDADVEAAAATLVDGAMYNSGQCCCGIERIYVASEVYAEFVECAVETAGSLVLGSPFEPETTLGPIALPRIASAARDQAAEAARLGARQLVDPAGFPAADDGNYLAPQVFVDVDHSMRLMREETFGPGRRHHEGAKRRRSPGADERQPVRIDRVAVDAGRCARRAHCRSTRNRHGLHEPVRLSRSGSLLDRLQGFGTRRFPVGHRVSQPDPAPILSLQEGMNMKLIGDWSYPTKIRFGTGRISELADSCGAAGIARPLFVTDRGLRDLPIAQATLDRLAAECPGTSVFSDVDPNPSERNLDAGIAAFRAGGHDGVVAFGGGSGIDLGKAIAFMAGQTRPVWDFEDIGDWWMRADADAICAECCGPDNRGDRFGSRARVGHYQFRDTREEDHLSPENPALGGHLGSGTDCRHAAVDYRRNRHGCVRALP